MAALARAKQSPVALRPPHHSPGVLCNLVLSVSYWLQQESPGEPILLPVHPLATLLGVDRTRLSPILGRLKTFGLLEVVEPSSYAARRATGYRFDLRHPLLRGPRNSREPGEDDGEPEPTATASPPDLETDNGKAGPR
jgi:hypothetical protein